MRQSAIIELRLLVSKQTLRFGQLYSLHLADVLCISLILIRAAACVVFFFVVVFFFRHVLVQKPNITKEILYKSPQQTVVITQ